MDGMAIKHNVREAGMVRLTVMQIRPAKSSDLAGIAEIDGTVESSRYLHVERSGEGIAPSWRLQERPVRQKVIDPNRLDGDASFLVKQIVSGADEGFSLVVEHEEEPVAFLLAKAEPAAGTMRLVDLRVDYEYRRQGMGTALVFQLIQHAREQSLRAVAVESRSNNHPVAALLVKCGFELSGIDTRRWSNHDLVKEAATLLWYAALD
jgi:ribosomal protein S18 acetylase RimI-like enzyme